MKGYPSEGEVLSEQHRPKPLEGLDRAMLASESVGVLADNTLALLGQVIPFQHAEIVLLTPEDHDAEIAARRVDGAAVHLDTKRRPISDLGGLDLLNNGELIIISDLNSPGSVSRSNVSVFDKARSYLIAPCVHAGKALGGIYLGSRKPGAFTAEHGQFAMSVAELFYLNYIKLHKIEQLSRRASDFEYRMAKRSADLEQQYRRRAALAEIELVINQPHELDRLLDRIAEVTTKLLPATGGASVVLWDAREEEFLIRTSALPQGADHRVFERVRRKGGATRWIVDNRKPLVVEDVTKGPYGTTQMLSETGYQAYAGIPLIVEGEVLGVLYAVDELPRKYSSDDIHFLTSLGNRAAVAVSKVSLYEQIHSANRLLEQKSKALEAANKELKEFAFVVSHDLKAPLRGIGSLAEWLIQDHADQLGDQGQELLALLAVRVKRMQALVDGVLQYSQIGWLKSKKTDVQLQELVRDVVDMVSPPANITIDLQRLPELRGDPTRLSQVFQNLISNAVNYMDKDRGRITVRGIEHPDEWEFSVEDNGPGIPEQLHDRIFQLFQTGYPGEEYESTGIGLALVKKIVEAEGGRVGLVSRVGEGSRFYFTLPKAIGPGSSPTG